MSFDGGRETWLNQFLPELHKQSKGEINIFVYFYSDCNSIGSNLIEAARDRDYSFVNIALRPPGGIVNSFFRIVKFNSQVIRQICKEKTSNKSLILGIGSFHEGLVPFLFSIKLFRKSNTTTGIWLRSILVKQLGAIGGKFYVKLVTLFERIQVRSVDHVISNGWDTQEFYKSNYNIDSTVIPNAVRLERFENIQGIKSTDDCLKISFIGRLSMEKGFKTFVDAILSFNRDYENIKNKITFEIVGDGPLKSYLLDRMSSNINYKSELKNSEIPNYLESIHCGVALTSASLVGGGGVSNGFLEILAAGRLVIAWDNLIYRQVGECNSIIYVEENSVNYLSNAFADLYINRSKYLGLGVNGRFLSERFSLDAHVDKFSTAFLK